MRARSAATVSSLLAASLLSACAHNPAPEGWRPPAKQAQQITRGGWIVLEPRDARGESATGSKVEGELNAVDDAAFHVLTAVGLRSVTRPNPYRMTIVGYGASKATATIWASAGGFATLTHGGFLLFTAPMWVITGIVAAGREARAGIFDDERIARQFARFPQGLPSGLDPQTLGPLVANPAAGIVLPRR